MMMTHGTPDPTDEDRLVDNRPRDDSDGEGQRLRVPDQGIEDRPRESDGGGSDVESP